MEHKETVDLLSTVALENTNPFLPVVLQRALPSAHMGWVGGLRHHVCIPPSTDAGVPEADLFYHLEVPLTVSGVSISLREDSGLQQSHQKSLLPVSWTKEGGVHAPNEKRNACVFN